MKVTSERQGLPKGRLEEPDSELSLNDFIPRTVTLEVVESLGGSAKAPRTFEAQTMGWITPIADGKRGEPVPAEFEHSIRLEVGKTYLVPLVMYPNPNDSKAVLWSPVLASAVTEVRAGKIVVPDGAESYLEELAGLTPAAAAARVAKIPGSPQLEGRDDLTAMQRYELLESGEVTAPREWDERTGTYKE